MELDLKNDLIPFVSVIISTLDSQSLITGCLTSVINTDFPDDKREIIVIDNGSRDGTLDLVRKFPVKLLRENKYGVCYCRNMGAEHSKGDVIVFTDPDCVVSKNWLKFLINRFKDRNTGIVAGGIVPYPGNTYPEKYAARKRSHNQETPLRQSCRPFAMTPNLAIRKTVLEEIGLFDSRFPGGGWEDADICWRFSKNSRLNLVYEPKALVFHRYRDTYLDYFIQHYRYGYGRGLLYLKYKDELDGSWTDMKRSLNNLRLSIYNMIKDVLLNYTNHGQDKSLSTSFLEFMRNLGQTLGFIAASFHINKFKG